LQAVLPEIKSLGASLVVLAPQLQTYTRPAAEKQALGFPILTHPDNKVVEVYGLACRTRSRSTRRSASICRAATAT